MSDMQPILDKIIKLLQLASKNPNANEAASAAAKAQELMAVYNLDAATVEKQQGKVDGKREDAKVSGGFYMWQRSLYSAVARLNFCMYWPEDYYEKLDTPKYSKRRRKMIYGYKRSRQRIIGRQVNIAATRVMCEYLEDAIERLLKGALANSQGNADQSQMLSRWANSFREGAVENIISRVQDERAAGERRREAEARRAAKAGGHSTARGLTLTDVAKTEEQGNYDFLYGAGAWDRLMTNRAEAAKERKAENERLAKLAKDNPEEFAREEKKRRKQSRGRSYRERPRDYSAYDEGFEKGAKISIHQQADSKKQGRLS